MAGWLHSSCWVPAGPPLLWSGRRRAVHAHVPARWPQQPRPPATCTPPRRSPKITYSDRFIPSRAASSRLDFSILDREAAASETPRRTAEKEESNGAYNMLLRSELLGCPAAPLSPDKAPSSVAGMGGSMGGMAGGLPSSPTKR